MKTKLILFSLALLIVGYSITDSYIIQPQQRPLFCDDCVIPISVEHAQNNAQIETGLLGAGLLGNRVIKFKKKELKKIV